MIVLFLRASFLETIADFFDRSARFLDSCKVSPCARPPVRPPRRRARPDVFQSVSRSDRGDERLLVRCSRFRSLFTPFIGFCREVGPSQTAPLRSENTSFSRFKSSLRRLEEADSAAEPALLAPAIKRF